MSVVAYIGAFSFCSLLRVFPQDHELHRQWVALVDDENPNDSGTQGYMHLSVAIVGPGDKLKVGGYLLIACNHARRLGLSATYLPLVPFLGVYGEKESAVAGFTQKIIP